MSLNEVFGGYAYSPPSGPLDQRTPVVRRYRPTLHPTMDGYQFKARVLGASICEDRASILPPPQNFDYQMMSHDTKS